LHSFCIKEAGEFGHSLLDHLAKVVDAAELAAELDGLLDFIKLVVFLLLHQNLLDAFLHVVAKQEGHVFVLEAERASLALQVVLVLQLQNDLDGSSFLLAKESDRTDHVPLRTSDVGHIL